MTNSNHTDPVDGYDLREYRKAVAKFIKLMIRARAKVEPDNRDPSTKTGCACRFEPRPVRYIRVTQLHNSANTGRHLVEVMAFGR